MKRSNHGSEFVRCGTQIKFIGFSMFLFAIVMAIGISISSDEMSVIVTGKQTTNVIVDGKSTVQVVDATPDQNTLNKLLAMSSLMVIASVIFILSLIITTGKGCYKTSLFGLIFGSLFGVL
jgi:hypothetical protein